VPETEFSPAPRKADKIWASIVIAESPCEHRELRDKRMQPDLMSRFS